MADPFVILFFPRFAGGKFLSNCLALSKHCVPQDHDSAEYLTARPDDYQYRLDRVLKTLPPDRISMINWIPQFEFGDHNLYGDVFQDWEDGVVNKNVNMITKKIIDSGLKTFLTTHGSESGVRQLYQTWPNSPIIKLINHRKFSGISWSLKSDCSHSLDSYAGNYCESKYNQLAGPSWPLWREFEMRGFDPRLCDDCTSDTQREMLQFYNWQDIDGLFSVFDVDNSYFDRDNFLNAMESLYRWLEFDDFNPELVGTFWQAYMRLHQV